MRSKYRSSIFNIIKRTVVELLTLEALSLIYNNIFYKFADLDLVLMSSINTSFIASIILSILIILIKITRDFKKINEEYVKEFDDYDI